MSLKSSKLKCPHFKAQTMNSPKKCVNQKNFFISSFLYKIYFLVSKKTSSSTQLKEQETKLQKLESEKSAFVEKIKLLEEKLAKQDATVSFKDLNFEMLYLVTSVGCGNFRSQLVEWESDEWAKLFQDHQQQRNHFDELGCKKRRDCHEQVHHLIFKIS